MGSSTIPNLGSLPRAVFSKLASRSSIPVPLQAPPLPALTLPSLHNPPPQLCQTTFQPLGLGRQVGSPTPSSAGPEQWAVVHAEELLLPLEVVRSVDGYEAGTALRRAAHQQPTFVQSAVAQVLCQLLLPGRARWGQPSVNCPAARPAQSKAKGTERNSSSIWGGEGNNQELPCLRGSFAGPRAGQNAPWSASPRARGRCTAPRPWCARRRRAGARCCRGQRGGARTQYRWPGPRLPHVAPGLPPPTPAAGHATVLLGPCKACRAPRAARKPALPAAAARRGGSELPPSGSALCPAAAVGILTPRRGQGPPCRSVSGKPSGDPAPGAAAAKASRASHHTQPRLWPAFAVSSGLRAPTLLLYLLPYVLGYATVLPTSVSPTQVTRPKFSTSCLIKPTSSISLSITILSFLLLPSFKLQSCLAWIIANGIFLVLWRPVLSPRQQVILQPEESFKNF